MEEISVLACILIQKFLWIVKIEDKNKQTYNMNNNVEKDKSDYLKII